MSNSHKVLESIEQRERAKSMINIDLDKFPTERALWDVTKDEFRFVTAAPIILPGKIIFRTLSNKKLGWDDPIIEDDCMI